MRIEIKYIHFYLLTLDFDELIKTLEPHYEKSYKNFLLLIKAVIEKGFPQELFIILPGIKTTG